MNWPSVVQAVDFDGLTNWEARAVQKSADCCWLA